MTVVVKFGSSLVVGKGGRPRRAVLRARGAEIRRIVRRGEPVCVVSSGAIALGLPRLGLDRRPRGIARLQAASALGQARLQAAWDDALAPLHAAQVLLTAGDIGDRTTYVNARGALTALLRLGAVPVVNENDATATDEITFGDNDALAAQVAVLLRARLLVLLTEVAGVYSRAPGTPGAELLSEGERTGEAALGAVSPLGKGGMHSKVLAAELAAAAGIPTVIAGGTGASVLEPILAGEPRGTRFAAAERNEPAFKLWLRFGKPVRGRIVVDAGARRALVEDGGSLLGVGVVACEGGFDAGDAVELAGPDGTAFAKGIASVPAVELVGRPRGVEAVHRDRLVVL
jgi:glutamate 5-kinase